MLPWCRADQSTTARPGDAGFSLVEILVAIALFMTVMVAVLPQLVVGLKGTAQANQVSEVKAIAQGRLETMRNLPYRVAPAAERRIDVLDTYFPNLTASSVPTLSCTSSGGYTKPDPSTWTGYVPAEPTAGASKRCTAYEPSTGAFYRKVDEVTRASGGVYTLVTDTQFMDGTASSSATSSPYSSTPTAPPTGYDTQREGFDKPAASQLAVTLTVFYANRGKLRLVSTFTQIPEVLRSPVRVEGKANAAAIDMSSTDGNDLSLSLGAGNADLAGSLSSVSKVSTTLAAISARQSTGDAVGLSYGPLFAPPTTTLDPVLVDTAGGSLPAGATCLFACWGGTQIERLTASADSGLPRLSGGLPSETSPVEARGVGSTLSFGKAATSSPSPYRPELQLLPAQPMVSMASSATVAPVVCGPSRGGTFSGRGFLRTTATGIETCAETASGRLALFPTNFAPDGVVRLTLNYAASVCGASSSTGTRAAKFRYSVDIEYYDPVTVGYQKVTKVYDSSTDGALPSVDFLAGLRDKVVKVAGGASPALTVGSYVASWSSPTTPLVAAPKTTAPAAEASLSGVVKLLSQPLRPARATQPAGDTVDPSSTLSMTLGSVSCLASDSR